MFGPGTKVRGTRANATSGGYWYAGYGEWPAATARAAGRLKLMKSNPSTPSRYSTIVTARRMKTGNAANSRISKGRREKDLVPCDAEPRTSAS